MTGKNNPIRAHKWFSSCKTFCREFPEWPRSVQNGHGAARGPAGQCFSVLDGLRNCVCSHLVLNKQRSNQAAQGMVLG